MTEPRLERSAVAGVRAEDLFDPEQLVVFADPVCSAGRSRFDLSGIQGNCKISNRRIFCFTGTMTHHSRVAVSVSSLNGVNRFAQRSDLVHFDQNAVCDTL